MKAARHNSNTEIIKILMKYGSKAEAADDEGNTALHAAAQRGTKEVAEFLLNLGANPYARNNECKIPYELCTNDEIVNVFMVCPLCKKQALIPCQTC